ncbi:hypothetical protein [Microbacterium aerolatum]|uniref:Uncharacterized protein n=1 Tax=Microbacterium aerolatum TaxID=153731 RepID=A0A511AGC2_9MICO|nr:hypothetical protein [Microbacterium aerolatum]GEK85741.1 hypothetical protein MAE01_09170 [Microbacterium aerolatum]GGB20703.1 hypothetical protein GCM10007198_08990 [Microbacterium aerolatum]
MRIVSSADPQLWIPVTESFGWKGRRHRKAAIRMLMMQAGGAALPRGTKVGAWALSQLAPAMMKRADGRVLVWTWKADPELVVAMATTQELTNDVRRARAMMPIEYDDTETFTSALGAGEKLVMSLPPDPKSPPFATYTWDTGSHLITVTAVGGDRERFGTLIPALDDLARSIRIADDLTGGESPDVLRIDPA